MLHSGWESDAILKIGYGLYPGANLANFRENLYRDAESHADIVYAIKKHIVDNLT